MSPHSRLVPLKLLKIVQGETPSTQGLSGLDRLGSFMKVNTLVWTGILEWSSPERERCLIYSYIQGLDKESFQAVAFTQP